MGAVFLRPDLTSTDWGVGVPARSPRRASVPRTNLSPRTPYTAPFSCHSYGRGIARPKTRSTLPIFGNLTPRSPFQPSLLVVIIAPAVPYYLPMMPHLLSTAGLLLGLIRARARCSPCGTSFGRSMQPHPPNSGGDGGPAYLRGVPSSPEVPGRSLNLDSCKQLHIHAALPSSGPEVVSAAQHHHVGPEA